MDYELPLIRQGDQYSLPFYLKDRNGNIIDNNPTIVSNVSITIGPKTKRYNAGQGELTYDSTNKCWLYPLTQTETFALSENRYDILVRVKFANNDIESKGLSPIQVIRSVDRSTL